MAELQIIKYFIKIADLIIKQEKREKNNKENIVHFAYVTAVLSCAGMDSHCVCLSKSYSANDWLVKID